ncbi:MAG: hypothetical protein ACRDUV_05550 [Pseudonocardiaceae bacterium]
MRLRTDEQEADLSAGPDHLLVCQPPVNSIRTETLTELVTAGEPMQFVADTYGLTLAEVEQAVTYQTTRRRAA